MLHFTRYNRNFGLNTSLMNPVKSMSADGISFNMRSVKYAERFVPSGYAWVTVDVRGTGASGAPGTDVRTRNDMSGSNVRYVVVSGGSRPVDFSPQEVKDYQTVLQWVLEQVQKDYRPARALAESRSGAAVSPTTAWLASTWSAMRLSACQYRWRRVQAPGGQGDCAGVLPVRHLRGHVRAGLVYHVPTRDCYAPTRGYICPRVPAYACASNGMGQRGARSTVRGAMLLCQQREMGSMFKAAAVLQCCRNRMLHLSTRAVVLRWGVRWSQAAWRVAVPSRTTPPLLR
eukprot:2194851-Rhodomonas_salina.2